MSVRIVSVATAVPKHRHTQEEVLKGFQPHFGALLERESRKAIFSAAGVKSRHSAEPLAHYFGDSFPSTRNEDYRRHALALARECLQACLDKAAVPARRIRHIFAVTTTGLLTPSLEALLVPSMGFDPGIKRTPIFGCGCAGGAVALARAAEYLKGHADELALVLSVELCSLTFEREDRGMTQLVAAALFGDGASACLLAGGAAGFGGPEILGSASELFPDSFDAMGWDFSRGMRLVLSPRVPALIEAGLRPAVSRFLRDSGAALADVTSFILHPGSLRIIEACERALGIGSRETALTRDFLESHGNLSSASILFVLQSTLAQRPAPSGLALLAAMGPGFSAEMSLLRLP